VNVQKSGRAAERQQIVLFSAAVRRSVEPVLMNNRKQGMLPPAANGGGRRSALVDCIGEVRAVDLAGTIELRLADGSRITVKISVEHEGKVTEALRDHKNRRLRVRGKADFRPNGKIKAVTDVTYVTIQAANELPLDLNAAPIWEIVRDIGASIPDEKWKEIPTDGAKNLDHYLYGAPKK